MCVGCLNNLQQCNVSNASNKSNLELSVLSAGLFLPCFASRRLLDKSAVSFWAVCHLHYLRCSCQWCVSAAHIQINGGARWRGTSLFRIRVGQKPGVYLITYLMGLSSYRLGLCIQTRSPDKPPETCINTTAPWWKRYGLRTLMPDLTSWKIQAAFCYKRGETITHKCSSRMMCREKQKKDFPENKAWWPHESTIKPRSLKLLFTASVGRFIPKHVHLLSACSTRSWPCIRNPGFKEKNPNRQTVRHTTVCTHDWCSCQSSQKSSFQNQSCDKHWYAQRRHTIHATTQTK